MSEVERPSRIQVLPPVVAERIAAGEVIERPASVVKELVENSLDAGATEILVALEDGGKQLIEVTDNGCGMTAEELALCVRRHATSKLRSLEDLEKIATLGFRGEALPSVAAVAELSILSRPREGSEANELVLGTLGSRLPGEPEPRPRPITFGHFLNSPHGTRLQVRGLFAQVPARLKFLKAQSAEVAQVREWLERLALAHPEAGFRLLSDGRTVMRLQPQSEEARVRALLSGGDDYPLASSGQASGVLPGAIGVRVHWIQGLSLPNSRRVVQVVNGRAVKDKLLQQAALMPFRQKLLPGQYPALALFVEIDPAVLDVNIHPTKTEVKFLETRKVFHAVESRIQSLIQEHGAAAVAPAAFGGSAPAGAWLARDGAGGDRPSGGFASTADFPRYQPSLPAFDSTGTRPELATEAAPSTFAPGFPALAPSRWVGILFNTYLAYDQGQELVLVDQHAAHERVRYERLRRKRLGQAENAGLTPQPLLIPEAVRVAEGAEVAPIIARLARLGFGAEAFGEDTLLFREIPAEWGNHELRTRLKSLVERVGALEAPEEDGAASPSARELLLDESLFEALASEACHSSVRAGDRLAPEEATRLVADLETCENPWNCPHGRPTLVRVPRAKFEEWFQRRV